ncbi:hypothetical protein BPOR_0002g00390 [Botrytis porri]|uniref:Uncharacterized protein n=1 Tax=Botrytis porri TaxID=87229 RepID=A0A4Z1L6N1_9HELO|nr:hypothetical protein BPOR_0002g00390 [Botrytis porri]
MGLLYALVFWMLCSPSHWFCASLYIERDTSCQASFSITQFLVTPKDIPIVTGFLTCAQSGGAALSLAIGDTVFLNTAQSGTCFQIEARLKFKDSSPVWEILSSKL